MVRDGKTAEAKAAAKKWWEENGAKRQIPYLESLLDTTKAQQRIFAASHLARMEGPRYANKILMMAAQTTDSWEQECLLQAVRPHIPTDWQSRLLDLAKTGSPEAAREVALALWYRFSNPAAIPILAMHLRKPHDDQWWSQHFTSEDVPFDLAHIDHPLARECLIECLRSPRRTLRWWTLVHLEKVHHPDIAEALVSILDDRGHTDESAEAGRRWCDYAILSLVSITGYPTSFDIDMSPEERDHFIRRWRTWWATNRETIDWEKLTQQEKEIRDP